MVTREIRFGNPSSPDKDQSENHGMDAENMYGNSMNYKCHANVKELNVEIGELGPKNMLIGQFTTELNAEIDKGLARFKQDEGQSDIIPLEIHNHAIFDNKTTLDMVGPSTSKPNGMWTHINRMNFGLGGLTRAITIPGLGKRDSHEI